VGRVFAAGCVLFGGNLRMVGNDRFIGVSIILAKRIFSKGYRDAL
jgi:hypothetical protein